nr:ImmA/IrrE family metallo-endopeptidase [uncultured Rhodopila sp.]
MSALIDPLKLTERYASGAPVPIFDIVREAGLDLSFIPLDDNISGWIEKAPGGRYKVAINLNHAPVRRRFTAAHELGHYIYHRDLLGTGSGDTRAYRSEGTQFPNAAIQQIHERQANSFAANLLMPRKAIGVLRNQGVDSVSEMARRFEVSTDAMRIRLGLPK